MNNNDLYNISRLIVLSIVYHIHKDVHYSCQDGSILQLYYIGLLALLSVSLLVTAILVYTSMQGSITRSSPRRGVTKLLYVKMALAAPELAWNLIGTYWVFWKSSGCEPHIVYVIRVAV